MATLTLSQPIDVVSTAFTNVGQGTIQSHTASSFVAKNPDTDDTTLDNDDILASISGTNFGNFDPNGVPHSGTITQIQTQDFMFHPTATLSGISIAVSDFLNFISSNNLSGLEAALYSGDDTINGSTGSDTVSSFAGNDTFNMSNGGNDTVSGGDGNDIFNFGAGFTAADQIDGGTGTDTLNLDGDYSTGITFAANTLVNVEDLTLATGHSYKFTTNNATVASGQTLAVDASALGASNTLTFNGSAETDGNFNITGGAGDDVITGGAGADVFNLSSGGNDTVTGGAGNNTFVLGAALTASDKIDGGGGTDTLSLNGDYSAGLTFGATTILNIETITLAAGHSYKLTTNDATVGLGNTLTIDGSALSASDALTFSGAAETNGKFVVTGGAGNDSITGGAGDDTLSGGAGTDTFNLTAGGNDTVTGGAGNNTFTFGAAFTSADRVDGGGGTDTLSLNGDYSAGVTFAATTMVNVETITLSAGHNYSLTTNEANVAAGQTLAVTASALGTANALTFNGSAETNGKFKLTGGAGNDVLTGGAGADNFVLTAGGNDTVTGGAGANTFTFGAAFTAADQVNGAGGKDIVSLSGDYSAGVTLAANTLINIETISLAAGHSYSLTSNDANVAAGQSLTVDASAVGTGNSATFNGAAETNGKFLFVGGAGTDIFTGGATGDAFKFAGTFAATDQLNGGAGSDALTLNGDYSSGLTFAANTIANIEIINLAAGHSYKLTTNDANVAAGKMLTVGATALGAGNSLIFDGSAETNGKFTLNGGAGNDTLTGGALADKISGGAGTNTLKGGGGADTITGGSGADTFVYSAVSESTGGTHDIIHGFDAAADKFDLPFAVGGIDAAITSGTLSTSSFNHDLAVAVSAAHLAVGHAVLFTANAGTLSGHTFLVVDANGTAGYQSSADYVFDITGAANLGSLSTADFI